MLFRIIFPSSTTQPGIEASKEDKELSVYLCFLLIAKYVRKEAIAAENRDVPTATSITKAAEKFCVFNVLVGFPVGDTLLLAIHLKSQLIYVKKEQIPAYLQYSHH